MNRRQLTFGGCALGFARVGGAQTAGKRRRLGFMRWSAPAQDTQENPRRALAERGYLEGQNIRIEWRWVTGVEQADRSAAELVQGGVDLINDLGAKERSNEPSTSSRARVWRRPLRSRGVVARTNARRRLASACADDQPEGFISR